jgi:hypothetical protein
VTGDKGKEWPQKARNLIAKGGRNKSGDKPKDAPTCDRLPWHERMALELIEKETGAVDRRSADQKVRKATVLTK